MVFVSFHAIDAFLGISSIPLPYDGPYPFLAASGGKISKQRIKVGEIEVGGKTTRAVSRSLPEQKALLETLGVPQLPLSI
jgi:hypothetical protein